MVDEHVFDRNPEEIEERIRLIAYGLWEEEGQPDGRAEEHWKEAERRALVDEYATRTDQETLELDKLTKEAEDVGVTDVEPSRKASS